jgi:hypothetical protein
MTASEKYQIVVWVAPDVVDRVDVLARYLRLNRSEWLRFAIAYADAAVTLAELNDLERLHSGRLTDEQRAAKARVTADLDAMKQQMTPMRLPLA